MSLQNMDYNYKVMGSAYPIRAQLSLVGSWSRVSEAGAAVSAAGAGKFTTIRFKTAASGKNTPAESGGRSKR